MIFPSTKEWQGFAARWAIERSFYIHPNTALELDTRHAPRPQQVSQPVVCHTSFKEGKLCAVAPLFEKNRECGLWVAPKCRQKGLGRSTFATLMKSKAQNPKPLHAIVATDKPDTAAMADTFLVFGFEKVGTLRYLELWRFTPD